ncbi:hypothetical protein PENTCL1PPCAC_25385, partial [Pristionchus entomophagus]
RDRRAASSGSGSRACCFSPNSDQREPGGTCRCVPSRRARFLPAARRAIPPGGALQLPGRRSAALHAGRPAQPLPAAPLPTPVPA